MAPDPCIILWEFTVAPEQVATFIAAYGPTGSWAQLFHQAAGYRGTELYRDRADPDRFVTADFWMSAETYRRFRETFAREYAALDEACERLTRTEHHIGTFALADLRRNAF